MIDFEALKAPFPPDRISWRVGSTTGDKKRGMALAYIDARDVMERLDHVCGPDNWQCRYSHTASKTVCDIGIRVPGQGEYAGANPEWVWKADGAGDTDFEADKGALSDAFKRAAVRWGIGRYLYDLSAPWVEIEPMGKSFKIKDSELQKLQQLLGAPPTPAKVEKNHGEACGPLTITKLKDEMRLFCDDLARCTDLDELNGLVNGDKTKAILAQCSRDLPVWWFGKEGSDNKGIAVRLAERRAELSKQPHEMLKAG